MDSSNAKYPVAFDEFPEVVEQPYLEDQASRPGETPKYLAFDPVYKEVAFEPGHKEAVFDHVHKEVVPGFHLVSSSTSQDAAYLATAAGHSGGRNPDASQSKTICGLAVRKFWIVLLLVATVVAAAVGGGVGGSVAASRAHQGSSNETSAESTSSSISTPAVTDQLTSSTTTSSSLKAEPTFLNNQTQDFAFQPFEHNNYTGQAVQPIKTQGPFHLSFNSSSYVWQPNGTHCCVTFCKQFTWTGWWCAQRFQPNASGTFDNGIIGCTGEETLDNSKTKCSS